MEEKKRQLDIELSKEVARGSYANLAVISHSSSEVVIDFARVLPGLPKAEVQNRIIMTPEHAKRLLLALKENLGKYETRYGKIELPEGNVPFPILGGGQA